MFQLSKSFFDLPTEKKALYKFDLVSVILIPMRSSLAMSALYINS